MEQKNKITHFSQLIVWQKAHELVLLIYDQSDHFPSDERFSLVTQMRRCVVSITSNIAEGFGRRTLNDKRHFYDMAVGSIFELQNQLYIVRDRKYISTDSFDKATKLSVDVLMMTNALISSLSRFPS